MDECVECGYVYAAVPRNRIVDTLRERAGRYAALLGEIEPPVLRAHPLPDTWSILEYACHVRDVLRTQEERVRRAQAEDTPQFASMRREERVIEERYNEQDPGGVADEIHEAAETLASTLEELDEGGWARTGVYNWPETAVRTVEWIGRHTLHECEHHLMDIDRLEEASRRP